MGKTQAQAAGTRDHLFISYAWEDRAFARWLALRLTAEGYKIWIDQFELLGGESWPRNIDIAIKSPRTFRVLGLLSKHSIAKPNPLKERTLALNIAKKSGMEGFLIPLNVDGLTSTDLDWLTSDITFVPFATSWSKGLAQLLKLLNREQCPRGDGDGRAIASRVAASFDTVVDADELLTSNASAFIQVPETITAYRVSPKLEKESASLRDALRDWACYSVSPHRVFAFHPPGADLATWLKVEVAQSYKWRDVVNIEGIEPLNVVIRLLRGCIETRLCLVGFRWSAGTEAYAFPGLHGQNCRVVLPDGAKTTVQHSGERTFFRVGQPKVKYRYRLAVKLAVERGVTDEFNLLWRLRFHLTDANGEPLPATQHLSRRKHLTKHWHNYHWLVRHLASMQRCADSDGCIRVGPSGSGQVVLNCEPASFTVARRIDETKLTVSEEVSDEFADQIPVEDYDLTEEPPDDDQED
jgi:TIR domain